jgi:hypothetical protein
MTMINKPFQGLLYALLASLFIWVSIGIAVWVAMG